MNAVVKKAAISGELSVEQDETVSDIADTSLESRERSLRTKPTGAFPVARQMGRDIVGKYPVALVNAAPMYALSGPRHEI
ncbi:MAG: hypothetical protein OXI87_15945 [Albidovulum sp.]|nr:hypothetical protein [Albidovulum sp.]